MADFYCPADGAICHMDHISCIQWKGTYCDIFGDVGNQRNLKTRRKIMSKNDASWGCESCVYYPPSSCDGKPCSVCDPDDPLLNCYEKKEH